MIFDHLHCPDWFGRLSPEFSNRVQLLFESHLLAEFSRCINPSPYYIDGSVQVLLIWLLKPIPRIWKSNGHGPVWARWNMIDIPSCIYILHTLWFSNIKRGNWKSPIKVYSWEHHLQMVDFPASHAWGPRRVFSATSMRFPARHVWWHRRESPWNIPWNISIGIPLCHHFWWLNSHVSWLSHDFLGELP